MHFPLSTSNCIFKQTLKLLLSYGRATSVMPQYFSGAYSWTDPALAMSSTPKNLPSGNAALCWTQRVVHKAMAENVGGRRCLGCSLTWTRSILSVTLSEESRLILMVSAAFMDQSFDPADCMAGTTNHSLTVRPQIEHSRKSPALGGDHLISHSLLCISQTADLLLFLHHHNHLWDLQRMLPKKKKEGRKGRKRKVLHSLQEFCEPEGFFMAIVTETHTQV